MLGSVDYRIQNGIRSFQSTSPPSLSSYTGGYFSTYRGYLFTHFGLQVSHSLTYLTHRSLSTFTSLRLSPIFYNRSGMPLPTIFENEPISFNEMAVQENPQAAQIPACVDESETELAKASIRMVALPSPINPSSRPMTPDSLFGEISDSKYVAYPVPDEPIPPIFVCCRNCRRNDHCESIALILVNLVVMKNRNILRKPQQLEVQNANSKSCGVTGRQYTKKS